MVITENVVIPEVLREDINRAVKIPKEEGCSEVFLFGSGVAGNTRYGRTLI